MASSEQTATLTNKLYNRLKFIALVLLPALATLWFAIAGIWGLPHTTEIVGTISAIDTFLGVLLHLTTAEYYKSGKNFDGTMVVDDSPDKTLFKMQLDTDPEDLPGKHSIEFRVAKAPK